MASLLIGRINDENLALIRAAYTYLELEIPYSDKSIHRSRIQSYSTYKRCDKEKFGVRRMAALIAFLYNNPAFMRSTPGFPTRSSLALDADVIPAEFNTPHGRMPLNSLLRYAYNFFGSFIGVLYSDDWAKAEDEYKMTYERVQADRICFALKQAFKMLHGASCRTKSKIDDANVLFTRISAFVLVMPPTCLEEWRHEEAELKARMDAMAAASAAKKAAAAAPVAEDEVW
jgi:hypothetical protein